MQIYIERAGGGEREEWGGGCLTDLKGWVEIETVTDSDSNRGCVRERACVREKRGAREGTQMRHTLTQNLSFFPVTAGMRTILL